MACNVALWDRIVRLVIGIALCAWAIAGGPIWAYIGIIPIITGSWAFCPLYTVLNIRTLKTNSDSTNNEKK